MVSPFDAATAFSRNLGVVSLAQAERLRGATVAIAGLGGVGGDYLVSLVRAGVGGFHLAEFDAFELHNFNRQYGANTGTVGRSKLQVMVEMARAINPDLRIQTFADGVTPANVGHFLRGADVAVNAMDIFAVDMHPLLINAASAQGLSTIGAVPLGLGSGVLAFGPQSMSYADYFAITPGMSEEEKVIQFALGFAPQMHHLRYLDARSVNLREHRGPSSVAGCKLCTGFVVTQVLLALLEPQALRHAPWYTYLDARLGKFHQRRLWLGNRHPLQRIKTYVAKKRLARAAAA